MTVTSTGEVYKTIFDHLDKNFPNEIKNIPVAFDYSGEIDPSKHTLWAEFMDDQFVMVGVPSRTVTEREDGSFQVNCYYRPGTEPKDMELCPLLVDHVKNIFRYNSIVTANYRFQLLTVTVDSISNDPSFVQKAVIVDFIVRNN